MLLMVMALPASAESFKKYKKHTRYDAYFKKYTKRYFGPTFDWQVFKAQAIAESNLNPDAKSPVGAQGLMQIMPRTYDEIKRKNKMIQGHARDARWSVAAGLWYNKKLYEFWQKGRGTTERLRFTFGSYNAGKGNMLKAQRKAIEKGLNPRIWTSIESVLNEVTGRHSKETIGYVRKIEKIKQEIR
ncbi:transglycosylase SLT domain-containing protein [Pleionea sp. CnH1-48]|uniref:transglycosylase SLT domain-containing protein n=1 Tax=Pleionea sp. CnH1-48 TaxID=2954494 RepID=UPI002096F6BF|nr:transglycosylase SLT domain-containing protein [Pleionea sp. CnH1-48]MCO7226415.1 transglycosylase SLT domain-containing protein [Pleionea sp. CnH1-48]